MKYCILFVLCIAHAALYADTVSVPTKSLPPQVKSTIYSQDGTQRISLCNDGKMRFFDLNDSIALREIPFGTGNLVEMQFTQDFSGITLTKVDSAIYRVAYPSGEVLKDTSIRNGEYACAYSYDGKKCVLFVAKDSSKLLLDFITGAKQPCLKGRKDDLGDMGISFSEDGQKILVVYSKDSLAELRLTRNDSLVHSYRLPFNASEHSAMSPDGKMFAVALNGASIYNAESTIIIVDIETGTATTINIPLDSIDPTIRSNWIGRILFSPDNMKLFAGNSFVLVVDIESKSCLFSNLSQNKNYETAWFSQHSNSLFLSKWNSNLYIDSLMKFDFGSNKITVLYDKQNRPPIVASGFNEAGEDLYCGVYHYGGDESRKHDSLVFWNGVTNREVFKKGCWGEGSVFSSQWFFSRDGGRLIENSFRTNSVAAKVTEVAVHDISAASAPLFTIDDPRQAIVSQDRRSIFILDTASYAIVDVITGDSAVAPFKLPDGWTVKAFQTETKLLCAFSTKKNGSQDSIIDWAGIWSLETGQCVNQFIFANHPWYYTNIKMNAWFLPDGQRIVVHDAEENSQNDLFALFDISTGEKLSKYSDRWRIFGVSMSPDGKQLLVGRNNLNTYAKEIYCFDAANGALQRLYKINHYPGDQLEIMVSFNPKNHLQFIYKDKIWELPEPLPVIQSQKKSIPGAFRIIGASSKRISFHLPMKNVGAIIKIFQPNGRMVEKSFIEPGLTSHRSITLPDLACGAYLYRLETMGNKSISQGVFLILKKL